MDVQNLHEFFFERLAPGAHFVATDIVVYLNYSSQQTLKHSDMMNLYTGEEYICSFLWLKRTKMPVIAGLPCGCKY